MAAGYFYEQLCYFTVKLMATPLQVSVYQNIPPTFTLWSLLGVTYWQ